MKTNAFIRFKEFLFPKRETHRDIEKENEFNEYMREILENRENVRKGFAKKRMELERYYNEVNQIHQLSNSCSYIIMKYKNELPVEVLKEYYLREGWGAYLPIELGSILKINKI